ncbi:MAG: hypothetical protein IPN74_16855 [Haliscomenobacter sp.]|nr:hypothetical protein [Haliscomenobacter sp.]
MPQLESLDDHVQAKRDREGLAKYSNLVSNKAAIASFCDVDSIAAMKRACEEELKSYLHGQRKWSICLRAAKNEIGGLWAEENPTLQQLKAKQAGIKRLSDQQRKAKKRLSRQRKREERKIESLAG